MAHYRVGDRILSREEYEEDSIQKWGLALFIIGALIAGSAIHTFLPAEWPKYLRFISIILTGCVGGAIIACFARPVRNLASWGIMTAMLGGVVYGIWTFI